MKSNDKNNGSLWDSIAPSAFLNISSEIFKGHLKSNQDNQGKNENKFENAFERAVDTAISQFLPGNETIRKNFVQGVTTDIGGLMTGAGQLGASAFSKIRDEFNPNSWRYKVAHQLLSAKKYVT